MTKETQIASKEGNESKVENKTVSETSHGWWVSRKPTHRVLQNILLHYYEINCQLINLLPLRLIHLCQLLFFGCFFKTKLNEFQLSSSFLLLSSDFASIMFSYNLCRFV